MEEDATTGGDADAAGDSWGEGVAIGESGGIEPESADSTDPLLFELIAGWLPLTPRTQRTAVFEEELQQK